MGVRRSRGQYTTDSLYYTVQCGGDAILVILALINGASFVALLSLGILVLTEERRKKANQLFAAWCFATAAVALIELLGRLSESHDRAMVLAQVASLWPVNSALFFHFSAAATTKRSGRRTVAILAAYALAAAMAAVYFGFARSGDAVEYVHGYSFTSPFGVHWPRVLVPVGYYVLRLGALALLAKSVRSGDGVLGTRELRWVFAAYGAEVLYGTVIVILRTWTPLAIPEMPGLSYLIFCVLLVIPLRRGLLTSLTPRRALEASLRASLAEKESLLHEVHHRVNNSLQLIISLLHLKSDSVTDPCARAVIEESVSRIHLISRVYERAYSAENLSAIRLDEYLRETAEEQVWRAERPEVALEMTLDPLTIDVQRAIVLGMIAAELISNAFAHAFAHQEHATLRLRLAHDGAPGASEKSRRYRMTVRDNGSGWDREARPEGTGLQLAHALAAQIGAQLTVDTSAGVTAEVVFSATAPEVLAPLARSG